MAVSAFLLSLLAAGQLGLAAQCNPREPVKAARANQELNRILFGVIGKPGLPQAICLALPSAPQDPQAEAKKRALDIFYDNSSKKKDIEAAIRTLGALNAKEHAEDIRSVFRGRFPIGGFHGNPVDEENFAVLKAAFEVLESLEGKENLREFFSGFLGSVVPSRDQDGLRILNCCADSSYAPVVAGFIQKYPQMDIRSLGLAVEFLGKVKAVEHAELIVRFLDKANNDLGNPVVEALKTMGRADLAEEKALALLNSIDHWERRTGVQILGYIGNAKHAQKMVDLIRESPHSPLALVSIQALGNMRSHKHAGVVLEYVKYKGAYSTYVNTAMKALAQIGAMEYADHVVRHLEVDETRITAAETLATMKAKKHFSAVVQTAKRPDCNYLHFDACLSAMETLGSKEDYLRELSDLLTHNLNLISQRTKVIQALHKTDEAYAKRMVRAVLADAKNVRRLDVLWALGNQKKHLYIPEVSSIMEDKNPQAAVLAASILFVWNPEDARNRVLSLMKKPETRVRAIQIVGHLANSNMKDIREDFRKEIEFYLSDEDRRVRLEAVQAFQFMGNTGLSPEQLSLLAGRMGDEDEEVRDYAFKILKRTVVGRQIMFDKAVELLKAGTPPLRAQAVRVFSEFNTARALEKMTGALEDPDAGVREEALRALTPHAGHREALKGAPAAARMLQGGPESLRLAALKFLAALGRRIGAEYADQTAGCLQDPSAAVRLAALETYAEIVKTPEAYRKIAEFLSDEDARMRGKALDILRNSAQVPVAMQELAKNLNHPNVWIRREALLSLAKLGDGSHDGEAGHLLKDEDRVIRLAAMDYLAQSGAKEHAQAIAEFLRDRDAATRSRALITLKLLDQEAAKKHVWEIFKDRDVMRWEDRKRLIETLGDAGASEFASWISFCIEDRESRIVEAALDALKNMKRMDLGRGRIADILDQPRKRGLMLLTLSHPRYADYAPEVRALLKNTDPGTRRSAQITLEKMGVKE